ncbi:MAG: hypothetical protein ABII80_01380 [bacterium]
MNYEIMSEMPEWFNPMDPMTWVKEDPGMPGESMVVAEVGAIEAKA